MANDFYFQFEKQFRGSRALIKERLKVYHPIVIALTSSGKTVRGLDLGCGRGEWLESLTEWGVQCRGLDLDEEMVAFSKSKGLEVILGDAVSYLKNEATASIDLITGFHIVEHLEQSTLHELLRETRRVLRPGGVVIFETPNPENINVSTSSFYLDPTHIRPLPPALLKFLFEYHGFSNARVLRLNSQEDLKEQRDFHQIYSWYIGSYRDYSIVAFVPPETEQYMDPLNAISYPEEASAELFKLLALANLRLQQLEDEVQNMKTEVEKIKNSLLWRVYEKIKHYLGKSS